MSKLFWVVSLSLFLFGCSVEKDMEDMKKTTEKMQETTADMDTSTDHIESRTENLFQGTREVMALERQDVSFDKIVAAKKLGSRIKQAATYFLSMEYQHWMGDFKDDLDLREDLMFEAARSFFISIDDYVDDDFPVSTPWVPGFIPYWGEDRQNWDLLSSLSVTMSLVHLKQVRQLKESGLKIYSMYDIITDGLRFRSDYEKGKPVPKWAEEVIDNERVAIYLLQLRYNFLPILIASKMSNLEEGTLKEVSHLSMSWNVNVSQFNKRNFDSWNHYLDLRVETKKFLEEELGVAAEENSFFARIFANLHWHVEDLSNHWEYISTLGIDPFEDQHSKFHHVLEFKPKNMSPAEEFILKMNEVVGTSFYITEAPKYDSNGWRVISKEEQEERAKRNSWTDVNLAP